MDAIWFACCSPDDYPSVRRDIERRETQARLMRMDRLDDLCCTVQAFGPGQASVYLMLREAPAGDVEAAISLMVDEAHATCVIAVVDVLDPGHIARLFHAGATEVIASGDLDRPDDSDRGACMEERTGRAAPLCDAIADDVGPRARREATEPVQDAPKPYQGQRPWDRTVHIPQPHPAVSIDDVDLDEPETMRAHALAALRSGGAEALSASAAAPTGPGDCVPAPQPCAPAPVAPAPAVHADAAGPAFAAHRAPVVCAISGRGGCGKSTLVAALAKSSSLLGLRVALIDLDLMFGNLYDFFGADAPCDIGQMIEPARTGALREEDMLRCAVQLEAGLTLWGPLARPEQAELMGPAVELMLDVLRREADIILVDTSSFWNDAVAAAVAASDRCLVVGDGTTGSASSAARAVELATRVGVPRTRMTGVFNRFGRRGCGEDAAMRFEVTVSLSSKARIADGGDEVAGLLAFGRATDIVSEPGPFAESVRSFARQMLSELGCSPGAWSDGGLDSAPASARQRLRLPWAKDGGAR